MQKRRPVHPEFHRKLGAAGPLKDGHGTLWYYRRPPGGAAPGRPRCASGAEFVKRGWRSATEHAEISFLLCRG
jgi:hypothetical protein